MTDTPAETIETVLERLESHCAWCAESLAPYQSANFQHTDIRALLDYTAKLRSALEDVRMLAMRIRRKTDRTNGDHLLRFCARVGIVGSILRRSRT